MSFLTSRSAVASRGFGKPVPRREDTRLIAGQGRYSDDFNLPGQVHAQVVRSPHAHARIRRIDASKALAVPGVIAALTGADALADGLGVIPHKPVPTNPNEYPLGGRDGSTIFVAPHPVQRRGRRLRHHERHGLVVAETA